MKKETVKTTDGKELTRLIPENDEDLQKLHNMVENGDLDPDYITDADDEVWDEYFRDIRIK